MSDVIFDCTELYQNPIRTGVQRVVRELLRRWPKSGARLHVVRFVAKQGLQRLPIEAVQILTEELPGVNRLSSDEIVQRLALIKPQSEPAPLPSDALLFVPEVFYDPARCEFYQDLIGHRQMAFLAYDFLPFTHPELFTFRSAAPLMNYIRLLRSADNVAHISEATRRDYYYRIKKTKLGSGPAIPLGADGWSMPRQSWHKRRRSFVVIGSIEKRKNQHLVFEAFQQLWSEGVDAQLVLIGRRLRDVPSKWLDDFVKWPQARWIDSATDEQLKTALLDARCTVFASESEGFGLPPLESLAAGIPVICHERIPSLYALPEIGHIRLGQMSSQEIYHAIAAMLDDAYAQDMWKQAEDLSLTTWENFATQASTWISYVNGLRRSTPM